MHNSDIYAILLGMEHEVANFLSQYIELTDDEVETINELDLIQRHKKGTVLLKEGEVCNECYLVLEGCLRSYYLIDGEEKTTAFYTEEELAYPVSYNSREPSEYYISCLEDCLLCVGNLEKTEVLVEEIPRLESLGHLFDNELMVEHQKRLDDYRTLDPEERYRKLLDERPGLCNRVPQYHLASYLGIRPETLSRIRRRIAEE